MKTKTKISGFGVGAFSLAAAGFLAPGAYAANTVSGDVKISNTETVQVLMGADGSIDSQRVYDQLVLTGKGKVDLANPVSTKGLRNLDSFGGFDVRDGDVRVKTDVSGTKKFRSVSDFTKDLPVKLDIAYTLNGKKVKPGDVVGKSGTLEVRYLVTNTTGVKEEVPFANGEGVEERSSQEVVIPMVGSLTTVLPSNFTKVQSDEANAAGDGRGGTQLSFTMTLIPPIGAATAEFGYSAEIKDGKIPPATMSVLPVNPLESPSFKGGAASYKGGAETGQDLTAGATEIDSNVLKLRDGAQELVAGLVQLRDGANQLSTGLNNEAVPGARKLAAGAGQLDTGAKQLVGGTGELTAGAQKLNKGAGDLATGAKKLNKGAGDLSSGLKTANKGAGDLATGLRTAKAGGPRLLAGVQQLLNGAQLIDGGLTTLNGLVVPGANQITGAATALISGITGQVNPGLDGANQAISGAKALVQGSPTMDAAEKTNVLGALDQASGAVTAVKAALNNTAAPNGFMYGLGAIKQGSADIAAGVDAQTSSGAADTTGTLKNGAARLVAGLQQLKTEGGQLVDGLNQLSSGADKLSSGTGQLSSGASQLSSGTGELSAGANQLSTGTGDLSAGASKLNAGAGKLAGGTGELSTGAGTLASGLGTAAAGSGALAEGLGTAASGGEALPEGAQRLSDEGTKQLIKAGNTTASDYGLKYALIEAGAKRAATAQPYGSPEGATSLTAYKFEISGAEGAASANVKRGIGAAVLLILAGGITAFRHRLA